jgi:purine-nucleoside phosphorylase
MTHFYTREEYEGAAAYVQSQTDHRPSIGLILGSGLSPLAEAAEAADVIPYADVPHFPKSTVEGHAGRLVLGRLANRTLIIMQGRVHFYEGYPIQQVVFPVRVMQALGVETLIVTNAAGGLDPAFRPGEMMLITDHINVIGMSGNNPLVGPNDPMLGPRFPSMSQAYDPGMRRIAEEVAQEGGLPLRKGVYAGLAGPSYESPAEIRFLRLVGADAVGMSTVPEVTVARHAGMRVLGVSGITNLALTDPAPGQETNHEEVLTVGQVLVPRLTALVCGVLARLKDG